MAQVCTLHVRLDAHEDLTRARQLRREIAQRILMNEQDVKTAEFLEKRAREALKAL